MCQPRRLIKAAVWRRWEGKLVQDCYTKLAITPKRGDAILFYSQLPHGELDSNALHGGCPVLVRRPLWPCWRLFGLRFTYVASVLVKKC
jgi:hypothetical protein|eukprot:COSAG01_NODE_3993_length_5456_cov_28.008774_9_plen_89_part_00